MNKVIEKGKTLLVDGPAAVTILSGRVEIFGFQATPPYRVIIREGKRLPFNAQEATILQVSLGTNATLAEVNKNTIPPSWDKAADITRELQKKPTILMVFGAADTGKTSFCTYLTNRLVSQKFKVAILDEDLGQSDIGPPCTVAYTYVTGPVTDLYNLREQNAVFVGSTSPSEITDKTIEAATFLKNEILSKVNVDFLIVNTDGWVAGEEAKQFKVQLAVALGVDLVFCLQNKNRGSFLCAPFGESVGKVRQELVDSSGAITERSRESRRYLRELGYAKYLKNAQLKAIPTGNLTIEANKEAMLKGQGENLLVGLYDAHRKFLGIGIIRKVDYTNKALKIYTAATKKPSILLMGKVRLDLNLQEIPDYNSVI